MQFESLKNKKSKEAKKILDKHREKSSRFYVSNTNRDTKSLDFQFQKRNLKNHIVFSKSRRTNGQTCNINSTGLKMQWKFI